MNSAADVFWWLPAFLKAFWDTANKIMLTSSTSLLAVLVAVALLSVLIRSLINKG